MRRKTDRGNGEAAVGDGVAKVAAFGLGPIEPRQTPIGLVDTHLDEIEIEAGGHRQSLAPV
jgi:hypothetical protein